jgi:hypothetical protein
MKTDGNQSIVPACSNDRTRNASRNSLCSTSVHAQVHSKIVLNGLEPSLLPFEVELCPSV